MGYIGILRVCWGYIVVMDKKMETSRTGYMGFRV